MEGHSLSLLFGKTFFQDLIDTADDDDCSFAPTFLSKVLGIKSKRCFSHKTHIYGHLWRQMHSIFAYGEELNVWKNTFVQDLIVMADDDDCSFAPTFPSKVLGLKFCNGLFSCNSHIWAPMAPNVLDLWL